MTKIEWTDELTRRFWSYVRVGDECWEWIGGTFGGRYGQFRAGARKVKAHRFAWEIENGAVPDGMILCHRCDNMRCVRPDHLFVGTHKDNAVDRDAKGRGRPYRGPRPRLAGAGNPAAKLSEDQVRSIRTLRRGGSSFGWIARAYGISPSQVRNICASRCWRDCG